MTLKQLNLIFLLLFEKSMCNRDFHELILFSLIFPNNNIAVWTFMCDILEPVHGEGDPEAAPQASSAHNTCTNPGNKPCLSSGRGGYLNKISENYILKTNDSHLPHSFCTQ